MTLGVQSIPGCGVTIKHFACNNREDNCFHSNGILPERALRELYLRGFGIAVRESSPLSITTNYNLINGVHAANNYDMCTKVARREFGFAGFFMTDWTTTCQGPNYSADGCIRAGNDVVMPGFESDRDQICNALVGETVGLHHPSGAGDPAVQSLFCRLLMNKPSLGSGSSFIFH